MNVYHDDYVVDWTDDDKPIYDRKLSHTALVKRARLATGGRELISMDWYADDPAGKLPFVAKSVWR